MNTERSENKAEDYLANGRKLSRKTMEIVKDFPFPPSEVFYQFCPTRELDWIDGWDCDLLYTTTGYVEKDCIFTTPDTNPIGPGLWIFTNYEPNEKVEIVRIVEQSVVIHFRIDLTDNCNGTCRGVWNLTFTALNETGNAIVENISEKDRELKHAIDSLEYFLRTGEMMRRNG